MKLVRNLGTEVVHLPGCSSRGADAPRWTWAIGKSLAEVKAASGAHPSLHLCRTCMPGCCSCADCRAA